jgi:hypothetical protein
MSAFPSLPQPSSLKIRSLQPTLVSVAHSLQRQVRSRGGHRWAISAGWPPMKRADWAILFGFAQAQRGQYGTFTYVLPGNLSTANGVATGTPLVMGASQTGRSIVTDGWTINITGILKAGDFIKFNGHAKVYMVTADANSNGSGQATISIEPALFSSVADNEPIITGDIPFTVAFAGDTRESNVSPGMVFDFSADMVEVP